MRREPGRTSSHPYRRPDHYLRETRGVSAKSGLACAIEPQPCSGPRGRFPTCSQIPLLQHLTAMFFLCGVRPINPHQRPEEQALGDRLVREEKAGAGPGVGISVEPPGFLKRLFSVPRNVRRTVSVNDVVVPVIGARDGWGDIRQVGFPVRVHCGQVKSSFIG